MALGCSETVVICGANIGTEDIAIPVFKKITTATIIPTFYDYPFSASEVKSIVSDNVERSLEILYQEFAENKNETLEDKLALLENTERTIELVKAFKEFKELSEEKEVKVAEGSQ